MITIPDWSGAACVGMDTEQWFPVSGNGGLHAKTVCSICPIQDECLDWAIDSRQQFGIWGGLTESERAEEVRRRNKAERIKSTLEIAQNRFEHAKRLHAAGLSKHAIAERMQIKVRTVERYIEMAAR